MMALTYEQTQRGWAVQTFRYLGWNDADISQCLGITDGDIGNWITSADTDQSMAHVDRLRSAIENA